MTKETAQLERDGRIVSQLLRYRILTNIAIQRLVMKKQTSNAVSKVTARLCTSGILNRHPLLPPQQYFTVGKRLVQQKGLPPRMAEPLGPQALPSEMALLTYAIESKQSVRRLTSQEMKASMPWLPADLNRSAYFIDAVGVLQIVIVDLGGSPRHIAQKVDNAIRVRLGVDQLDEMAKAQRLQVTLLTTSREKVAAVRKLVDASDRRRQIKTQYIVVSILSQLLLSN